jgi:ABC-type multidrug transport system fused ATPase/permease subunit
MTPHTYYTERILAFENDLALLKKKSRLLSWARLVAFIGFTGFLILFFTAGHLVPVIIASLVSLVAFAILVNRNFRLEDKITLLSNKIQINKDELLFLDHNYQHRETGSEFVVINPYLANDFDLFGTGSLYQYINRSSTRAGKTALAKSLCTQNTDAVDILRKQAAIRELCQKNNFIQDFQANGKSYEENGHEAPALQSWLAEPDVNYSTVVRTAMILALINIAWTTLAAFNILTWASLGFPLFVSILVVGKQSKHIIKAHSQLENISKTFAKYKNLFSLIEEEAFSSEYLQTLQKALFVKERKASGGLNSLFRVLAFFDIRDNVLLAALLNAFFLFDIHVYYRLLHWKAMYKQDVNGWFSTMTEFDQLISFATFAFNNSELTVYPTLIQDEFKIAASDMGHPLLPPAGRVNNSITISGTPSVVIITGANMAGKSTFLRTVAVNLILAMNGAPVPTKQFEFTPCSILSSIKIQDSLANHESYFYAELVRLKEIIEQVEQNPRTLVILDEILRGTNTKDKQTGSLGLLEKLISLNTMVIIATHDLVIGNMKQKYPNYVSNHCFEVELTDDQLFFDYKLKNGISKKLNASFLMKKMEIID